MEVSGVGRKLIDSIGIYKNSDGAWQHGQITNQ